MGWAALGTAAGPAFRAASPILWWIVNIPAFIGFWWFTMWFLLAGRISWRRLYPCAVTTGAFWLGMLAVFSVIFSGMVISYDQKYGPIGIVLGPMSFFIAIRGGAHPGRGRGPDVARPRAASGPRSGNRGGHHDRQHRVAPHDQADARLSSGRIARTVLRVIRSAAALVAPYYLLPLDHASTPATVTMLLIGLAGFIALVTFQVRSPGRRKGPE